MKHVNRFALQHMEDEETTSSIWRFLHPPPLSMERPFSFSKSYPPPPDGDTPGCFVFLATSVSLHPQHKGACQVTNHKYVVKDTIIQWNIWGLRSNFEELKLLLSQSKSMVLTMPGMQA
ncbi:hypothetical protein PoB_003364000 [Plakobranchus ocellatus]|uniref:Uncharacterized protein n=1 Tax=Plakobranchus ocellatus TaxID=259542 RepID=A0AAV4AG41_9GAST|nr:hypothetical protein PoB_003364000 [Plakobranchus ocellatus]